MCHGEEVVACKSFVADGEQFVPFNDVGESTLDEDKESSWASLGRRFL